MKKNIFYFSTFLLVAQFLAACASPEPVLPADTPVPPTETSAPPTNTVTPLPTDTPTLTPLPSTDTPTLEPTFTPTQAITDTPTATATFTPPPIPTYRFIPLPAASSDTIRIYFIQSIPGSGACGDRVFAVGSGIEISGDIEDDVKAGLTKLFSYKDKYYGELYNPLYASRIRVQKVDYNKSGLIEVWMSGSYKPTGDPCDNTRVKAQIWSTIKQFRGVETTNIFLNDIPFGDRLANDK
jgi:hypothetical protein